MTILKIKKDKEGTYTCPHCKINSVIQFHTNYNQSTHIEEQVFEEKIDSINTDEFINKYPELYNLNQDFFLKHDFESIKIEKQKIMYTIKIPCLNNKCNKITVYSEIYNQYKILTNDSLSLTLKENLEGLKNKKLEIYFELEKKINIYPEFSIPKNYELYLSNEIVFSDYKEALKIKYISPNGSALLLRRFINALLLDYYEWNNPPNNLNQLIQNLPNDIEEEVIDTLHRIRQKGNIAAHPDQFNGNTITTEQIEDLFALVDILITDTYKVLYDKNEKERIRSEKLSSLNN